MKAMVLVLVIVLCVGYCTKATVQAQRPDRFNQLWLAQMLMESEQREHEQEVAKREFDNRMELKRKADTLNALYKDIGELLQVLGKEQTRQFQLEVEGERSIKQDVLVSKLSGELKAKVDALNKLNHVK